MSISVEDAPKCTCYCVKDLTHLATPCRRTAFDIDVAVPHRTRPLLLVLFCIMLAIIQLIANSDVSRKLTIFQVLSVTYVVHNSTEHERTCTCAPCNSLALLPCSCD